MTALQHIMRLHAVLAGDETDATAAFFKSRIVKAEFLLRHTQGTLLSLRISRGIALFPETRRVSRHSAGGAAGDLAAPHSSAYRRLMARTVVLRPSNGLAAMAAFSQMMIVVVRIAFPEGRHFRQ
ncbi:hypothetical protein PCC82_14690 [Agrobacterium deltaense]